MAVGIAGLILVALGFVTGPIPGPGGIPLVLLGLAIWSSEFEWAHRLMMSLKAQLHRFRQWSRPKQVLFWVVFFSCCGLIGYLYASLIGVPGWMPDPVDRAAAAPARRLTGGQPTPGSPDSRCIRPGAGRMKP